MRSLSHPIISALLALLLFLGVNILARRYPLRYDLTEDRLYEVSPAIQNLLGQFKDSLVATLYLPETVETQELFRLVTDQLEEFKNHCPGMKIEKLGQPGQGYAEADRLRQKYQIPRNSSGEIIFEYQGRFKKAPVADLAEFDRHPDGRVAKVRLFRGQQVFLDCLASILAPVTGKIYFSEGHGELSLREETGLGASALRRELELRAFRVDSLPTLGLVRLPTDTLALVLAGPRSPPFTEAEARLFSRYLERGGRMLVLLDPAIDPDRFEMLPTGLEEFLADHGFALGSDLVVDLGNALDPRDPTQFCARDFLIHPVTALFTDRRVPLVLSQARSVTLARGPDRKHTPTLLITTGVTGWGEKKLASLETGILEKESEDLPGPVAVAGALEGPVSVNGPPPFRLLVLGDSDLANNIHLSNAGNRDFLMAALGWLLDRSGLAHPPGKDLKKYQLNLPAAQLWHYRLYILALLPFLSLVTGAWVYYRRHHRA